MGGILVAYDKEKKIGGFDEWEVKSCYETLTKAREILNDKKKVAAVRIYAAKAVKAAAEVATELELEKTVGKKLAVMHNPAYLHKGKK